MNPNTANVLTSILAGSVFLSSVLAQPAAPRPQQPPANPAAAVPETSKRSDGIARIEDDTLVTLDFPGGTIGTYIEALRKAIAPKALNVLLYGADTAALPAPAIRLTSAGIWNALGAIERNERNAQGGVLSVRIARPPGTPTGGTPTYTITSEMQGYQPDFAKFRPQELIILSLNPIIGIPGSELRKGSAFDSKVVLAAVESAVAMISSPNAQPASLKFHEASGLLFVRGDAAQQRAAKEVIARLQDDVQQAPLINKESEKDVVTRRVAVELKEQDLPMVVNSLKETFAKLGPIDIQIDGAFLVIKGSPKLVDKVEEQARSWHPEP